MSKIQKELLSATKLKTERGEDRQDFLLRVMAAVSKLSDKAWDDLSQEAQDWFNDAADAKNAKAKSIPDFADAEPEEEEKEEKTSRRSKAKDEDDEKEEKKPGLKLGAMTKVTTKRGKTITGKLVEMDDEVLVLELPNGEEEELDRSRVESVEQAGNEKSKSKEEDAGPKVGDTVVVTTKRGKEVTGMIIEMDQEVIVLEVDGEEEEFNRDRVESIKAAGKKSKTREEPEEEEKEEKTSRRSKAKDEDDEKEEKTSKRASNGGVSIGTRIKEIIAENLEASETEIAKILKKEGLDFKENTLKLNYVDCHKFIDILRAKKMIKG